MNILGQIPRGLPSTSLRCGVLRSTRILTLDYLPAPIPWTTYCLRFTLVRRLTIDSTKFLVLFYSPTERVPETRQVLFCTESRSATQRRSSWFLTNIILLSSCSYSLSHLISPGWSLIMRPVWWYLIFEGLNKLVNLQSTYVGLFQRPLFSNTQ